MTQNSGGNEPWLAPYGSAPPPYEQSQSPYGAIEDAPITAQDPYASRPTAVGDQQWQTPHTQPAPQWQAPASTPAGMMPASTPYAGAMSLTGWANQPQEGNPGDIDLPWYGIGPVDAVKRAYLKTFRYTGRASRGEYWWFALFNFAVTVILGLAPAVEWTVGSAGAVTSMVAMLITLVTLAHIPVGLSLTVRRLHDTGNSGWLLLICLVPYIGALIVLILCCTGPNAAGARYDPGGALPYRFEPPPQPYV